MANKARKLQKKKEKYMGLCNEYRAIRSKAVRVIVAASVACAILVGAGLYSGNALVYGFVAVIALPAVCAICCAVQCNRDVKKLNLRIAEVDQEIIAWDVRIAHKEQ